MPLDHARRELAPHRIQLLDAHGVLEPRDRRLRPERVPDDGVAPEQQFLNGIVGVWGYHPLVVSLANTPEPLFLANRSGNRPSSEGAAERFDQAQALCREAGFQRITFRGDTDLTQTRHLDGWDAEGVRFVFGCDARANLIGLADAVPPEVWTAPRAAAGVSGTDRTAPAPANVKAALIVERTFKILRLEAEAVAEFAYQPVACAKPNRILVVRKNISVAQGDQRLFDEFRTSSISPTITRPRRPTSSSWPTIAAIRKTCRSTHSSVAGPIW